jgi:hypothetical protein
MMYSLRAVRSGRFPSEPEVGRSSERATRNGPAPCLSPAGRIVAALRHVGRRGHR